MEEVKHRKGLTERDLQRGISEDSIQKIARFFDDVESCLYGLKLSSSDKGDVKRLEKEKGVEFAMKEALRKWGRPNPYAATYHALIKILLDVERGDIALKIAGYLKSLKRL